MEFLTSGMGSAVWATLILLVTCFSCYRIGSVVLVHIEKGAAAALSFAEFILFSSATGFIFLALGILLIGLLGFLYAETLLLLLVLFVTAPVILRPRFTPLRLFSGLVERSHWVSRMFACAVLVLVFLSWVQATLPPIGTDALVYHLSHPKRFILDHSIHHLPLTLKSLMPYQTEMFFTLGLLWEGTILAKLFHWMFYPMTSWAIYMMTSRFYGRVVARIAALTFLATPVCFAQSGYAYVDISHAFFVFLAVYAFLLKETLGSVRAAVLSGVFLGGALATKYTALAAFVILAMLWLFRSRVGLKAVLVFTVTAWAIGGIWYFRSWLILGNPIYPFFPQLFGGHGDSTILEGSSGMGRGFVAFLLLGWNVTMFPASFGGEILGPAFLMFLPLLLFMRRGVRPFSLDIIVFTLLYAVSIFMKHQLLRFFLTLVPFLSIGVAVVLCELAQKGRAFSRWALTVCAVVLALHGSIFLYRTRNAWEVLAGTVDPITYLSRWERSFRGYQFLKESVKKGERVLNAAEIRNFFDPLEDTVFLSSFLKDKLSREEKSLRNYLEENRFAYIWVYEHTDPEVFDFIAHHGYEKVFFYAFEERPALYRYEIYRSPFIQGVSL